MASARKGRVPIRWYQCRPSKIIEGSILLKKKSHHEKITKNLANFGIGAISVLKHGLYYISHELFEYEYICVKTLAG